MAMNQLLPTLFSDEYSPTLNQMTPPGHLHWLSCKDPWWRKPNDGHFHWLAVRRRLFVHECLTKTGKRVTRGCASPPELLLQAS